MARPSEKERTAPPLDPSEANATVVEVHPKLARVLMDSGEERLCTYRRASVVSRGRSETRERSPVCAGDRLKVEPMGSADGVVQGIAVRRNQLTRAAPGRDEVVHVLVANVDLLVIVATAKEPAFNPGLVDRFLIGAQAGGIPAALCINKMDLLRPTEARLWELYRGLGVSIHELSAKGGAGTAEIGAALAGKRVVFAGHSGVGKTSLLRVLLGRDVGKVGELSEATAKGRHTTTSARGYVGPGGGTLWFDTPGVRAFGLPDMEPDELIRFFPELASFDAKDLATDTSMDEKYPRLESYRRILESLRQGEG